MIINIKLPNGKNIQKEFSKEVTSVDIIESLSENLEHEILSCRIDNVNERLDTVITQDCHVDLLDMTNSYANMVYQNSLTMLYIAAIKKVVGDGVLTTIENSLSKGLFTTIHIGNITDELIQTISDTMHEMVEADIPIEEKHCTKKELIEFLRGKKSQRRMRLYKSAPDLDSGYLCSLGEKKEIFYLHLVPSTKYLKVFELRRYRNGILLRYPYPNDPEHVPEYVEQKKLYEAFSEETIWEKLCGVNYAADLNNKIDFHDYKDLILLSEALHEKKIAEIAGKIKESKKRIILIAGPSSSGKTTFAKRLCIQLRVLGLRPLYLGTDDYFKERSETPILPNGEKDFESLRSIDIDLFTSQMNDLLAGKEVDLPEFDFISGTKKYGKRITSIDTSQPIVIEGIHGLNPKMTEGIEEGQKFKIYISPLTSLNIDEHHRVPTTDARMLRRMVRDARTRGRSAANTIHDWPAVRAGEDVNIFPYNDQADVFFNSQCIYELSILKKYVDPLLKSIGQEEPEYSEAQRMLMLMKFFVELDEDSIVPNNSILREFIGGSVIVEES